MKISKLFHWLYGFVMLLPIFAIGSACLISTFNMASKEESEIIYKYETNEVNSESDLIVGNIYHYTANFSNLTGNLLICNGLFNINNVKDYNIDIENEFGFIRVVINTSTSVVVQQLNSDYTVRNNIALAYSLTDSIFECDLVYRDLDYFDIYTNYSKSDFNVIENIETNNVEPQNVFYDSVDKVQQMPIFSWAYNSFLVAPFQYILVLFGVPANHVIVELLSYWLAVSIIWLVFDLIMYIPLLVHRWLDKGVLE